MRIIGVSHHRIGHLVADNNQARNHRHAPHQLPNRPGFHDVHASPPFESKRIAQRLDTVVGSIDTIQHVFD